MANNNHFELTLDTLAPSGSITRPSLYLKAPGNLTIASTSTDATFMKVWYTESATGSKTDANYPTAWESYATSKQTNFAADGTYFYHLVLMDAVRNESEVFNTEQIIYDHIAPVVTADSVYIEDPNGSEASKRTVTNQLTNNFGFSFSDTSPSSGIVSARISCTDFTNDVTISNPESPFVGNGRDAAHPQITFKEGTEDGTKTITVYVTDAAGNESAGVQGSILLDRAIDTPTIVLTNKDTSKTLPEFINFHDINVTLSSNDEDIVGYKIWEGSTEPTDWTTVTAGSKFSVTVEKSLSSSDGIKTVYGKTLDDAGTESAIVNAVVKIDTQKPVVSISSNKTAISNVTGYNEATLTLVGTDDTTSSELPQSGVNSYTLKCGDETIDSGTVTVPATFKLTSANSMVEGSNTITLTVTDIAGNTNSASCTVTLDTAAPTASINAMNAWYTSKPGMTINTNDTGVGISTIKAWTDTTPENKTVPSAAGSVERTGESQVVDATSIGNDPQELDSNYMHIQVVDKVGNTTYAHAKYGFDSVAPSEVTAGFVKSAYNTVNANITISSAIDATSGVIQCKLSGDVTDHTDWFNFTTGTFAVTLKANDVAESVETKTVYVYLKDAAGNESGSLATIQCELDQSKPGATLVLSNKDDSDVQPAHVNTAQFSARVSGTDDTSSGQATEYNLWGDFTYNEQSGSGTEYSESNWKTLTYDKGTYMLISKMFCTTGDGTKTISLKVRDNAGNESAVTTATFDYDTTAPTVDVSDIDSNRISKSHAFRKDSATTELTTYADETKFKFTPDSVVQAFKVCAYISQAKAIAGSHDDNAIPMTNGSTNMSGSSKTLPASEAISAMIKGADFEAHFISQYEAGKFTKDEAIAAGFTFDGDTLKYADGLKYVVVYVQDLGGTWSENAVFTVS